MVDVFDTETGTWLPPTQLSEARSNIFSCTTKQGVAYFAGGVAGYYSQVYYSDRVDVFNSTTRKWQKTLKLPQARAFIGGGCAQDVCVFGGGYYLGHYTSWRNPTITNRIDVLNVKTHTWEKLQLLEGRASMGSTVVRDRFVVFAGGRISFCLCMFVDFCFKMRYSLADTFLIHSFMRCLKHCHIPLCRSRSCRVGPNRHDQCV